MNYNTLLIILVSVGGLIALIVMYLKAKSERSDYSTDKLMSIDSLLDIVKRRINEILTESVLTSGTDEEIKKSIQRQQDIEESLSNAVFGIEHAKRVVLDVISGILREVLPTEEDILRIVPFDSSHLQTEIMFEVLLYYYRKKYGRKALTILIKEHNWDAERYLIEDKKQPSYAVTNEQITAVFLSKLKASVNVEDVSFERSEKHLTAREKAVEEKLIAERNAEDESVKYLWDLETLEEAKDVDFGDADLSRAGNRDIETIKINYTYDDLIKLMSILLYQRYKGFGIIDTLREMDIDGVNCGASGSVMSHRRSNNLQTMMPAHRSVWLYFEGKYIHLRFLSFNSKDELMRVISLLVRYNRPGPLTERRGYIVNTMEDQSRIMATVPPMSEYPAVFIRKFTLKNVTIESLVLRPQKKLEYRPRTWERLHTEEGIPKHILQDMYKEYRMAKSLGGSIPLPTFYEQIKKGHNLPGFVRNGNLIVNMLKYIILGQLNTGVTGRQGSGKTTLLTGLVKYVPPKYNMRILEMAFELYLRELYPERNILTVQETAYVSATEAQDVLKKSDSAVSIAGEVASDAVAAKVIQFAQIASIFTLFSHHANTTEDLVTGFRNHLIAAGNFSDMYVAEQQVLEVLNMDIHLDYTTDGYRYIDRITEIVPLADKSDYPTIDERNLELSALNIQREYYYRRTDRKTFTTRDIIRYDKDTHSYVPVNQPTYRMIERMVERMDKQDQDGFLSLLAQYWPEPVE